MKTNIVVFRPDGDMAVRQNTKNSFFNATDLLNIFNKKDGTGKRIQNYLDNEATKRYMVALIQEENLIDSNWSELENTIISSKTGKYGGTWMHPYLFIDFAMWLSPEFKVKVVRWVYDNLIKLRIDAGDSFKEVNEALFEAKPNRPPFEYSNEARLINKIVFGKPDPGQRDSASEDELSLLRSLQKADVAMIKEGKDYYDRYSELLRIKKYL